VCCYAGDGGSRIHVSAREYYTYLIQIRDDVFVIFFYGGRLFQQWLVDVYVKIESMHLDWYSNPEHQKIIRANLYQVCYLPVTCTVFVIKPFFLIHVKFLMYGSSFFNNRVLWTP